MTGALASFYRPPSPLPYAPAGTDHPQPGADPGPGLPPGTRAYRVLFHSTSDSRGDLAESGVVVVPGGRPPAGGFPIVSWAHGTTGVASGCAPSVTGTSSIPDLAALLKHREIVAATDYRGLGAPGQHPYLVGTSEAEDVLDAARAARALVGMRRPTRWPCWASPRAGRPPSSPARSRRPTRPSSSSPEWPRWPR